MITYTVKVSADGTRKWYIGDKLNRLDGPAVEYSNGTKAWFVDDKLNRLDGPAVEWSGKSKEWWVGGKRHRLDGPAIEWNDGYKAWFVDDVQLSETDFKNRIKKTSCVGKVVEVDGKRYKLVEA